MVAVTSWFTNLARSSLRGRWPHDCDPNRVEGGNMYLGGATTAAAEALADGGHRGH
jgi:hypothetical protein